MKKVAAPEGVGWGTTNIPQSQWVDVEKEYTCGGKRVIHLHITLHNHCGNEVTYPVKGNVVVREKPLKMEYHIWSLDGKSNVVWPDIHFPDLVLAG